MIIFYIFLTLLMVLDCVILVLLVLLQLPKKEAGAGMAFGGGATDALFGAGSGNVLTKITKYAVGIFFGLAIVMAWSSSHLRGPSGAESLTEALSKPSGTQPGGVPVFTAPSNSGVPQMQLISNLPPATTPAAPAAPATPATNK
jgi:preprotein translocase subunit SecG